MKKTPLWGNALLILNVHQEHDTLKLFNNIVRFSRDIFQNVPYASNRQVLQERGGGINGQ